MNVSDIVRSKAPPSRPLRLIAPSPMPSPTTSTRPAIAALLTNLFLLHDLVAA